MEQQKFWVVTSTTSHWKPTQHHSFSNALSMARSAAQTWPTERFFILEAIKCFSTDVSVKEIPIEGEQKDE